MPPVFEQTLMTHSQGPFVCSIQEFCLAVLEKIIKGLESTNKTEHHIF